MEVVPVYELVHLIEEDHTPDVWPRVERTLPDYKERRRWLAERGAELLSS